MIQIRMLPVIVVSIMMLKRVRFTLERDTTIQVRVDIISRDTVAGKLENPLSLNLYNYCANNPILYFDPSRTY